LPFPLISHSAPALQLAVVERHTAAACRGYEHPGADQFIADMTGWAGIPGARCDPGGLGEDVVTAVGDLAQLLIDSSRLRRSAAYRIAVRGER
jgi:hypothetical protein